jgi:hypothetical protein
MHCRVRISAGFSRCHKFVKIGKRIRFHEFPDLKRIHAKESHLYADSDRRKKETMLGHGDLTLRRELINLRKIIVRLVTEP